jgi:hypothetical protein
MKLTALNISLALVLLCFTASCSEDEPIAARSVDPVTRTFESLRKVDDHPLYLMHFYADYDFGSRLRLSDSAPGPPPPDIPIEQEVCESIVTASAGRSRAPSGPQQGWACTCFSTLNPQADAVYGRNFDWYEHPALILFTDPPGGYAAVSMVDISYLGYSASHTPDDDPEALLGAPFVPFDGMNEKGLAVGIMAVPSASPPYDPGKPTLTGLEMIRYMLDEAATVAEAVALTEQVNIDFTGGPPLHYMISDASRGSAVVEFTSGGMSVIEPDVPWQVATNFIVTGHTAESAKEACWRYRIAYTALEEFGASLSGEDAIGLLQSVSQSSTRWSVVYGMTSGDISVVMGRHYDTVLEYALK